MMKKILQILLLLSGAQLAQAFDNVQLQGLFPGKAVLMVDGQMRVLTVGQSVDGVKLISVNNKSAVLEVGGEQKQFEPGSAITTSYQKPEFAREIIAADDRGMFFTHGSINGHSIKLLVDTGATAVAMSSYDAKRLGILYSVDGELATASTASGLARAWRIKLRSVKVGTLEQKNVEAMVIDGGYPEHVLLGMTFLERMKVSKESNRLTIEQKN
jgi:aspartyl protease family protein